MIKISADSTCDLSPALLQEYGISLVPLGIVVEEQTYLDGVNITPADLFRYVEEEKKVCRTSAVNAFTYEETFRGYLASYDAVIHICISAEFSSCYQNACQAASRLENVYVIDSRNLSTGSGHLVLDAARMAQKGMAAEAIYQALLETVPKVDASFVIDQLGYLRRGGRCSAITAGGAKLLRIKPCIEVVGGKMDVGKKYRGSFDRCLKHYVKDRLAEREDIDYSRIFITHTTCQKETVDMVRSLVEKYGQFEEILETDAGCTVSNHCGPNTLGILFKRK